MLQEISPGEGEGRIGIKRYIFTRHTVLTASFEVLLLKLS